MATLTAVDEPLARVRAGVERRVAALGSRVGDHLAAHIGRPGKMLRARYALLLGAGLGVPEGKSEGIAAAAELAHNASLLHDDCIDDGRVRRGEPTPNALHGDRTAILLGNLAFTAGLDEARKVSPAAAEALAAAAEEMAVGEMQEEFLRGSLNVSLEGYFGLAARKTGALFEWVGGALSGISSLEHDREVPVRLGRSAGILLQAIDDIHDFTLDEDTAGKPPGQDLVNGRLTLPGILAMDDEASRPRFRELWKRRAEPGALQDALALFAERGHLDAARAKSREVLEGMLPMADALPGAEGREGMKGFIRLMLEREF